MKKHNSFDVLLVMDEVVTENPGRTDRRIGELAPRYVDQGQPNCLVAVILARMGISLGVLRQLDREQWGAGGIILWATEHSIRRRFTTAAWELLSALQFCNDIGDPWTKAAEKVRNPEVWLSRRWDARNEGRPWLGEEPS